MDDTMITPSPPTGEGVQDFPDLPPRPPLRTFPRKDLEDMVRRYEDTLHWIVIRDRQAVSAAAHHMATAAYFALSAKPKKGTVA